MAVEGDLIDIFHDICFVARNKWKNFKLIHASLWIFLIRLLPAAKTLSLLTHIGRDEFKICSRILISNLGFFK